MYYGASYLFVFFKDRLPTHYSLDGCLSMQRMFCESSLHYRDVVNAFFSCWSSVLLWQVSIQKPANPCTSDLLTIFTPVHWEHNINIEHTFSAFYCFKTVESGQTRRIRFFQFIQIALPDVLQAEWFVKLKPRLLVLKHSNHRSEWKHQWEYISQSVWW